VAPVKKVAPGKAASTSPSLIASDLRISGDVLADGGEIQIDGAVQGNVSCKSLLVGETAVLTGGVFSAEDIVVRGKIEGTLRGVRVSLQASSEVEGDIHHKSLAIEEGAFFEGKSRREDNPMANAKPSGDTANRPSSGAAGGVVSRISPGSDGKQE
jgi:cytoskeletal protein CcmA (bactofilin family)